MHSYTTPAILVLPIETVDPDYHAWIDGGDGGGESVTSRLTSAPSVAPLG